MQRKPVKRTIVVDGVTIVATVKRTGLYFWGGTKYTATVPLGIPYHRRSAIAVTPTRAIRKLETQLC